MRSLNRMATNPIIHEYTFSEAKSIIVSGDIHGDFNLLVNTVCVQYQIRDAVVIVAGDCGFGFEQKGYYDNIVRKNAKRMNECNNWIVFVRGNHDNPAYFDGKAFVHKRFLAVSDYAVLNACDHTILCVGGAISIDRSYRRDAWEQYVRRQRGSIDNSPFAKNYYWEGEAPAYNPIALENISAKHSIDTVITHTAPSFCELLSKGGLGAYALQDVTLLDDVAKERATIDEIYNALKRHNHPMAHWVYGHFHQSWNSNIDGVLFKMLDIMELYEIR